MSELLLEIFSEEIPARMQARAEADLQRLFEGHLKEAGLSADTLETFSGPRRIGLVAHGLPDKTEDVREERKGPRTDALEKALAGFLRGAGLESVDQCNIEDNKKGAFYVAVIEKPGRQTRDVIAEAVPAIIKDFPWPKSMKFGEGEKTQRWVRPLHRITCLFRGEVVPLDVFGIKSSNQTEGHRVHSKGDPVISVTNHDDYVKQLQDNGVILKRAVRQKTILEGARQVCLDTGLELVEDEGLLEEVTGLVEYPVPVLGEMDPEFLDLPPEVITLTMKVHQKYFAVRDPKSGELAPKFVMIANQSAPDGGQAIAEGAARVLSARLSDARHFWDLDKAKGLEAMASELDKVTFHDKLGTVADKVERVAALARELAPSVGADPDLAETAARLAKADLVSQMVYEFPELQGAMGRYYAMASAPLDPSGHSPRKQGEKEGGDVSSPVHGGGGSEADGGGILTNLSKADRQQVADAIRDHYKPQGPSDEVPTAPVSAAVALADKLDTLFWFWVIDEKPTGSKDPFALRRAALGMIRLLQEGKIPLSLIAIVIRQQEKILAELIYKPGTYVLRLDLSDHELDELERSKSSHPEDYKKFGFYDHKIKTDPVAFDKANWENWDRSGSRLIKYDGLNSLNELNWIGFVEDAIHEEFSSSFDLRNDLLSFFADRLKVHLKDEGIKHDVIDAVFAPRLDGTRDDDLVRVTNKARALQKFLETEDGEALLAGYRRAANILKAEEKKDGETYDGKPSADYLKSAPEASERDLITAIETASDKASRAIQDEDFAAAMSALALLRAPVDQFFDNVVVNSEDTELRRNRLLLLSRIRSAVHTVADFSKLEG